MTITISSPAEVKIIRAFLDILNAKNSSNGKLAELFNHRYENVIKQTLLKIVKDIPPPPNVDIENLNICRIQTFHAEDHTYSKPKTLIIGCWKISVTSWRELIRKMSDILYYEHSCNFEIVSWLQGTSRLYFSTASKLLQEPQRIADSKYFVEQNLSANNSFVLAKQLARIFGYDRKTFKIIK